MRPLASLWARQGGLPLPWRTLLLTSLVLALYLVAGPAPQAWVYDRGAIVNGELWRLVIGHLVHSDGEHALWDIAALALLGSLFEGQLKRWLFLSLAIGGGAIDLWLWWGMPALTHYCGLSGVLNSLLAMGLWQLWREGHDPLVMWVAAGAVGKIAFEALSGQALFTATAWPSVPSVHGIGFAAGLVAAALAPILSKLPGFNSSGNLQITWTLRP
jgi:rhomboid family GlyGly-CTERM serine protease